MLDLQFIRDNADAVQKNATEKGYRISIASLLEADTKRRDIQQRTDELRAAKNANADKMQGGKPSAELIETGKQIKQQLAELEEELREANAALDKHMALVPNMIKPDVPLGDEDQSVEVGAWGGQPTGATDHLDFALARGWVDFERGAKVAGAKFYFLKNELAELELALLNYGMQLLRGKGFTYLTVPHMVNTQTALGAGFAPKGDESGNEYFIDGEDLTMIGTAEAPLTGYHAGEILAEADLPLFYVGYSPCYRKEAGAAGKHTRGLFRVHQFNKLEMYAFTLPEQSEAVHEQIREIEEEIWQSLEIPYHIINIASGDLGAPAAKKYDLEYWSAVDGTYRELTSCSNCTDFQARNLNIRVRRADGSLQVVHTLNGTAISMARSLIAIMEHHQQPDGTLRIPAVLQPFMGGREVL